ncbi:MAG: hypothetical protein EBS53_18955, partial [Bacteroidetes bacterium]|nr:hypothetical protein [Bacteroidota bacterium]
ILAAILNLLGGGNGVIIFKLPSDYTAEFSTNVAYHANSVGSQTLYKVISTPTNSNVTFYSNTVSIDYLVVAGGGGAGRGAPNDNTSMGGAGAGGMLDANRVPFRLFVPYTLTVGSGGAGSSTLQTVGGKGNDSVLGFVRADGGGTTAQAGGSGGAGSTYGGTSGTGGAGNGRFGAVPDPIQGNYGGGSPSSGVGNMFSGGGGGAGQQGGNTEAGPQTSPAGVGRGGNGRLSSITGVSTYYAGGGGGAPGGYGGTGSGVGGLGGGGSTATSGNVNTGGGGGGAVGAQSGGSGGSGIVVFRAPTSVAAVFSPGVTYRSNTIASNGNVTYIVTATSTASENVIFYPSAIEVAYLVVGGGGAGG